ncbi:MAG TPA: hypothetical protein VEJ22_02405 [Nitrospirota bacterium]|nr:hypothetical protein [Nitrospirota bacterium]
MADPVASVFLAPLTVTIRALVFFVVDIIVFGRYLLNRAITNWFWPISMVDAGFFPIFGRCCSGRNPDLDFIRQSYYD